MRKKSDNIVTRVKKILIQAPRKVTEREERMMKTKQKPMMIHPQLSVTCFPKSMDSLAHAVPPAAAAAASFRDKIIYEFVYTVCPSVKPPESPLETTTVWTSK